MQPGEPALVLTSDALNISVEARTVEQLAVAPFSCPTGSGASALALVPPTLFDKVDGSGNGGPTGRIDGVLWISSGDVHGVDEAAVPISLSGPTVSFSLFSGSEEVPVEDAPSPILLRLPVSSASELADSCVGQPDARALFERASRRSPPCAETLECRYYDEAAATWSSHGCGTVELSDGSGVGCECSHLSDFIAVKVPTEFDGEIEFAALDLASDVTLHCACTNGVELELQKEATLHPIVVVNISLIDETADASADVRWRVAEIAGDVAAFQSGSGVASSGTALALGVPGASSVGEVGWLGVAQLNGSRLEAIPLLLSAHGLAEKGGTERYVANLLVEVSSGGATRNLTVPVRAAVAALPVGARSTWGVVAAGSSCTTAAGAAPPTLQLVQGSSVKHLFTACDTDGLPVAHSNPTPTDPRLFTATIRPDVGTASIADSEGGASVSALGGGVYEVDVRVTRGLGLHAIQARLHDLTPSTSFSLYARFSPLPALEPWTPCSPSASSSIHVCAPDIDTNPESRLQVTLDGEALPWQLTVDVQCAAGKGALSGSGSGTCGCAAGTTPSAVGGSPACEPCAAGFVKEEAGDSPCRLCEVGTFAAVAGSMRCHACAAGTFAPSRGAELCAACTPGTVSSRGAASCSLCPPGEPPALWPPSLMSTPSQLSWTSRRKLTKFVGFSHAPQEPRSHRTRWQAVRLAHLARGNRRRGRHSAYRASRTASQRWERRTAKAVA